MNQNKYSDIKLEDTTEKSRFIKAIKNKITEVKRSRLFINISNVLNKAWIKILLILCEIVAAIVTKNMLSDHYQRLANSHYDLYPFADMFPILLISGGFAIASLKKKRYYAFVMLLVIAGWAFYFLIFKHYTCLLCLYGG